MELQQVLIDGAWRQAEAPEGSFQAPNPATKEKLPDSYPLSSPADIEAALEAGIAAARQLRSVAKEQIAAFLAAFAANIEARREALVTMAHLETALPEEPRLNSVELPRTTNQLRQAAEAVRTGSWRHATIDTRNNIRSYFAPLNGPVAVFGPNNFPFAFNSVAGGDFVAAIAAGNPVIAKANTSHPGTTRLLTEAAFDAVLASDLPAATVQLLYRVSGENGLRLVSDPRIAATGFTGSRGAGLRLKAAADAANKPIYLELSSINPVFILPGALNERPNEVVAEFCTSCLLGAGQFCTNPGLVALLDDAAGQKFVAAVTANLGAAKPGVLLGEGGPGQIGEAIEIMKQHGARVLTGGEAAVDSLGYAFQNTLLLVSGDTFIANPAALQTEAFGSVSLFVLARDEAQLLAIAGHLEGNLTGTIYSDRGGSDEILYSQVEFELRPKVGRLINDRMPTGVTVSPGMVHGGPPPSTGHPGFTAVGIPASITRFAALQSYDNVRQQRLPPELQDHNPDGVWRLVDGAWTQRDL